MSSTEENTLQEFDGPMSTSVVLGLSWSLVVASLFFSIATYIACCCACCNTPQSPNSLRRRQYGVQGKHFVMSSAACLLLFASVLARSYGVARRVLEKQDYKGRMRITGWTVSDTFSHPETDHNENDKYAHYIEADMTLEWGYGWACPDHNEKHCISSGSNSEGKCKTFICETRHEHDDCSEEAFDKAIVTLEDCATDLYDPSLAESGYYVPFVPEDGPSTDENWPNLVAYGDCDSCQARDKAPSTGSLKGLRASSIVFLVIAFGFLVGAVVYWRQDNQKPEALGSETHFATTELPQHNPVVSYDNTGVPVVVPQPYTGASTSTAVYNPYNNTSSPAVLVLPAAPEQAQTSVDSPPIVYAKPIAESTDKW